MGVFDKIRQTADDQESEMSFLDHLEELRWHLIRSGIVVLIAMIFMFVYIREITDKIILAPYSPDFPTYEYLCKLDPNICNNLAKPAGANEASAALTNGQIILQASEPSEQFTRAIFIAIIGGFILSFPYLVFEIWRFVKPGLSSKEKKGMGGFIFYTTFLFFTGVLFSYYVVSPLTITFLANFKLSDKVVQIWKIGDVISLVVMLCVAGGILFEMPILAFFLGKMGIVNAAFLSKYRRHAIVGIFIAAGVLTPSADMMTQVAVVIPLLFLYEVSIWVVKFSAPKNELD